MNPRSCRPRRLRSRPGVECLEARSLLSASGTLDPTFASGQGFATVPISIDSGPTLGGRAVAVQSNGQIVMASAGTVSNSGQTTFLVTRFNADGTLDTSFGTGGKVLIPFNDLASATAVAIETDGQIVVGGLVAATIFDRGASTQYDPAAARLNSNGTLDTSFGIDGGIAFPVGAPESNADSFTEFNTAVTSILVQADGSILLAGDAVNASGTGNDYAAARLTASGTLDTSYGGTGIVLVPAKIGTAEDSVAVGAALQSTGQLVIAGLSIVPGVQGYFGPTPSTPYITAIRLNTDGTLDTSFGTGGEANPFPATSVDGRRIEAMTLQPNDDIILAGDGLSAIRLNADGTLDTSFGTGGEASYTATDNQFPSTVTGVAVDPDGNIVLAVPPAYIFGGTGLIRFTPSGALDSTFGNPSTPGLSGELFGNELINPILAVASDGNIIVATVHVVYVDQTGTQSSNQYSLQVGEVLSQSTTSTPALQQPAADYDGSGTTNLAVYLTNFGEFAYRPTNGNPDVLVPFGSAGAGQTIPAPGDYDGAGHAEIAAYLTGLGDYAISSSTTGQLRIIQFGIPGAGNSIPAPGDYYGTGVDDIAVYLPSIASFAIKDPTGKTTGTLLQFGIAGAGQSIPAPADYYGTGQDDIAVYLAQAGAFAIQDPTGKTAGEIIPFGKPGLGNSIPVPGDYDGSGHVEVAVYVPSVGGFFYRPANGGADVFVPMGTANSGDLPAIGDYDGSGHDEFAIYDPTGGFFEYKPYNGGADVIDYFGQPGAGNSVPSATPAGALPEFNGSSGGGSGSGNAISIKAIAPKPASVLGVVTPSSTSAAPAGPMLASARVALSPVAQARPDPLDWLA